MTPDNGDSGRPPQRPPGSDQHRRVLISAKGVLCDQQRVLLVKNARSEWELPGGKLAYRESPEEGLVREIREELGISVGVGRVVAVFNHHHYDDIIVIVYQCDALMNTEPLLSDEHSDGGWFDQKQIRGMNVPENYRRVILRLNDGGSPLPTPDKDAPHGSRR